MSNVITNEAVIRPVAREPITLKRVVKSRKFAATLSVVVFLVAWQLIVPLLPTLLIPMPSKVLHFMWDEIRGQTLAPQTIYQAFGVSLLRLFVGLIFAILIGVPLGLLMGMYRRADAALNDFVVVGLAMPSLVWALLAGMWWGLGFKPILFVVILAAVWFITLNVAEGVRAVPKNLKDMAAAYGKSEREIIRHVTLPSLAPFFFAALRYGLANGWKGLVLVEVYAGVDGAGWMIRYWYDAHRAQGVIGYAIFFMIFAVVVERLVFGKISDHVFRWKAKTAYQGK
jgi:NitT/TauT family transport system permease protein